MANEGKASETGREDGASNRFTAAQGNADQRSNLNDQPDAERTKGDGSASLSGSLQKSARTITREIKREGRRLVADATDSATSAAAQKQGVAAGYLRTMGEAISNSCSVLDDRGYQGTSGFVRHMAEELGVLADNLEGKDPRDLLTEVKNYARANPAIFLGASLLAGFGIVRLLKSDADDENMDEDFEEDEEAYDDNPYEQQRM